MPKSSKNEDNSSSDSTFDHTLQLQVMDSTYLVDTTVPEIEIEVDINVDDKLVTITIPPFAFILPNGGFLSTNPAFTLPKSIRHKRAMPYSTYLISDEVNQYYVVYVFNDGNVVIGAENFQPLSDGVHNTYGGTVSYKLDKHHCVPDNVKLSNKTAKVADFTQTITNDLLDFYNNDIYDNVCAFVFSANPPNEIAGPEFVNYYAAVGKFKHDKLKIKHVKLLYRPDVLPGPQRCLEDTISINPTNKKNIVATATFRDNAVPVGDPSYNRFTIIRSYSFNGGKSWTSDNITKTPSSYGLPHVRSDPNALFDSYGNYWLCYMTAGTADLNPPFELVFAVSSDGGINFTVAGTTTLASYLDYPRLTFGGDGQGGKALWFSVDFVNSTTLYVDDIIVGYIQVSGLGSYGTLTYSIATGIGKDVATDSICYLQVPEITASPDGEIYLFGPTQIFDGDNGNFGKSILYKHVGGITDNAFTGPYDVLMTNVGGNDFQTSAFGKPVPFQPNRGVFPNGARGIDYDAKNNRIWICSNNLEPNVTSDVLDPTAKYNMSIFAMYSDNDGASWSPEIKISDTHKRNRAMPSIKVDPKTGNKAIFWYDGRDGKHDNGATVKPYGAVFH